MAFSAAQTKTLLGGKYSDYKVKCQDKTFNVYKMVIGVQSPFFEKCFSGGFVEASDGMVELKDTNPAAVAILLCYFYTGRAWEMEEDMTLSYVNDFFPWVSDSAEAAYVKANNIAAPPTDINLDVEAAVCSFIGAYELVVRLMVDGLDVSIAQYVLAYLKRCHTVVKTYQRLTDDFMALVLQKIYQVTSLDDFNLRKMATLMIIAEQNGMGSASAINRCTLTHDADTAKLAQGMLQWLEAKRNRT